MSAKDQVFASDAERGNYYKLSRQWGGKYRIYHNLPFLNVFNTKELLNLNKLRPSANDLHTSESNTWSIGDIDFQRLKKTSIDYTLCDHNDRPLLCIEFDGFKDGFNVGTQYYYDGPPDPWRELITGLKLKVAHGSMFPFFVVGYQHFKDLTKDIQLSMVDGIIGEVLSRAEIQKRIVQGFDPTETGWPQEDFANLPPDEQHEVVQDWLIGVEVESEMKHSPIAVKAAELECQIPLQCSCEYLTYPSADNSETLEGRRKLIENAILFGCRCTLHGGTVIEHRKLTYLPPKCGPVSVTVWLPNFSVPGCSSMLGLLEELSKLVALEKARKLLTEQAAE